MIEMLGTQAEINKKNQLITFSSQVKDISRKGVFLSYYLDGAIKGGTVKVLQDTQMYFPNINLRTFLKNGSTFEETQEISLEEWENGVYDFEYKVGKDTCTSTSILRVEISSNYNSKWSWR